MGKNVLQILYRISLKIFFQGVEEGSCCRASQRSHAVLQLHGFTNLATNDQTHQLKTKKKLNIQNERGITNKRIIKAFMKNCLKLMKVFNSFICFVMCVLLILLFHLSFIKFQNYLKYHKDIEVTFMTTN